MVNLDELVFKVDATEVERANRLIVELGDSIQALDKKVINSANKQSIAEARAARASKDNAKARLDNAKAIDVEEKAEERKQKALEKTITSTEKAEKVTRKKVESTKEANAVLERQNSILEYQVQGWSRGQSGILASAKATGALTQEMKQLEGVLETQRKLMADPFDKSASGLKTLQREYKELSVAIKEYNSGSDLTAKQARDLARDRERIIVSMRSEGKSILEIQSALKSYASEYSTAAATVNNFAAVEKANLQVKKDIASATRQVTQEDERMAAALNTANVSMSKAATDSMVKYETNLRRMGLTQDEFTKKLVAYKSQLAQVQAQEEKRSQQHLARALSPQMTDIAVSLYSGQSPLTVLLQQGGQIADLFRLSGVEAQNFGKAMRDAFSSMIPVMATVAKGMLDLIKFITIDAVAGMVKFVGSATGVMSVLENMRYQLTLAQMAGVSFAQTLLNIGKIGAGITLAGITTGIGALVTGLVGFGVAAVKAIKESDALARAMFNADAGFKATHGEVLSLSTTLANTTGGSASNFSKILGEMAKQGGLAAEDVKIFGQTASDQMIYLGASAEDVVKKYSDMAKAPVEGLQKLAESTGKVSLETLKYVSDLVKLGDEQKAQEKAMQELARVQGEKVSEMKQNLSGFAKFVIETGTLISKFFNQVFDMMWKATDPTEKFTENLAGLKQEFEKVSKMGDAQFQGDRTKYLKDLQVSIDLAQKDLDVTTAKTRALKEEADVRSKLAKDNAEASSVTKEFGTPVEKAMDSEKKATKAVVDAQNNLNEARKIGFLSSAEEAIAIANITKLKHGEENARKKVQEAIDRENKKDKKGADKIARQAARDQETYNDIMAEAAGYTKSYNNQVDALNRGLEAGTLTQSRYNAAMEALEKSQPGARAAAQEMAKAQELVNKYMGEGYSESTRYNKEVALLDRLMQNLNDGSKQFGKETLNIVQENLKKTSPEYKKTQKAAEEYAKGLANLTAESEKLTLATEKLMQQQKLSEMSPEFAKVAKIEMQAANKAKEEQIRLEKEIETIRASRTTSDVQKEVLVAVATNNSLIAQKNILLETSEAYNEYINTILGGTDSVISKLNELASASGNISFANAVSSIGGLITAFDKINAKQVVFNKLREEAAGDSTKLKRLQEKESQSQIQSYGDITGAMKGFFKEGTKGYKTLNTAEKAFRTYEAAMAVKNSILRIAAESNVLAIKQAADKESVASTIWAVGKTIALKMKEAGANAIAAVTNQGNGDYYTAFARIAAMTAIMAALGFAVAGGGGGSTAGGDGKMTYSTGKGTVLGDSDATSKSIANSLSILENVDTLTMQYSYEMLKSLRKIEQTMAGVTSVILRSSGIQQTALGIQEGTTVNGVLGHVAKVPVPLLGKLLTGLFGTKTTITGQGVYVNDASYSQIRDEDITAGYYTDINKKRNFLGMTISDKNSTNYQESAELSQQFAKILNSFVDVVKTAGDVLGVSGEEIDDKLKDFVLKIGKIDLKDLKGDEITEKLMSVFGAAGDDIAKQALAGFEKYQQAGEGYLETIVRVAVTTETVRNTFDSLNRTIILTVDQAMELVDAFGSLEEYSESTTNFLKDYYSAEERKATLTRQVTAAMAKHNLEMPKSREEYRKLVEAQDLTTEEGRKMYAWLIELAPAFAEITESTEDLAKAAAELKKQAQDTRYELEDRLLAAQGKDEELKRLKRHRELLELMALDPSLVELQNRIWEQEDANEAAAKAAKDATDANNKAMSGLQKAVAVEKTALQERVATTQETINKLKSLFDLLEKSIKTLYDQVDQTAKMSYLTARGIITSAAGTARAGGDVSSISGLSVAIEDVMSGLSSDDYSTKIEYDRERLRLADELNTLKGTAKRELTTAEKQLESLNDQIKRLDSILEYWQMQIDIANGTYTATLSVTEAIEALHQALFVKKETSPTTTNPSGGTGRATLGGGGGYIIGSGSSGGAHTVGYTKDGRQVWSDGSISDNPITSHATDRLEKGYDPFGSIDYSTGQPSKGNSVKWDEEKQLYVPAFANGGRYSGGLALVGEEGPELINFAQAGNVSTASQTGTLLANSQQRVAILEAAMIQMASEMRDIKTYTKRTSEILTNVTPNGDSLNTTAQED